MKRIPINEKWLYQQYVIEEKSSYDIAKELGISPITIQNRLRLFGWIRENKISLRTKHIRRKLSEAFKGKHHSEETKASISKNKMGEKNWMYGRRANETPNWQGGKSFEPYCHKFNFELKEKIRNRDNRICCLCGKSEIENGRRLCTHHIDGDKMQGCDGKKWNLVTLCLECNSKESHNRPLYEFLIVAKNTWRV